MSDAKYGEHGKIYSRKRRYHKKDLYAQKVGQSKSKSQMADKSQVMRETPALKPGSVFPWEPPKHFPCRSIITPEPAVIRAERLIKWRKFLMDMVIIFLTMKLFVLIMILLYGR